MTTIYKLRLLGCYLGMVFLVVATTHGADELRFRTWVLPNGVKIEAQFQRIKGNNAVIVEPGGKIHDIALGKLSTHDAKYLRLTNRGIEPDASFDAITEAKPFIIDINKGESKYLHRVKYPGKIDASNLLVEITISADGNRAFPSSTLQMQPVALGKTVKYVIRLAPKPNDETIFDLAADVEAWVTYDTKNPAFIVHVKPSVDVIRGRGGAEQITLSVGQCQKRMAAIDKTIRRHTQEIMRVLPPLIENARIQYSRSGPGPQQLAWSKKLKSLLNAWQSAKNSIPALTLKYDYLDKLAAALQDMKTITVQYKIFSKVGGNLEPIVDGTSKDQ